MGRRSFISMSTINRLISASNRREREEYNQNLIAQQAGKKKELPPRYDLIKVEFNVNTRMTKIEILQTNYYRTIDKYITKNYVKYPIYSDWKTKKKEIKKSIKLTNQELESLNLNDDPLIRHFAEEIIVSLQNEELYPAWFLKLVLEKAYNEKINSLADERKTVHDKAERECNERKEKIANNKLVKNEKENILKKHKKKKVRLENKITKIEKSKSSIVLNLLTFFLYGYLNSTHRKNKLLKKLTVIKNDISLLERDIEKINENSACYLEEINKINQSVKNKDDELKEKQENEYISYQKSLNDIHPLECNYIENNSFKPLKLFSGIGNQKIIGCYVIHNKENNKYYVGQSKDVLKRLKQHFKGTVPNNIIFAEDYYSSLFEDKSNLFEVKIIECATKDELDATERELIEEYDSFNSGYNETIGNT